MEWCPVSATINLPLHHKVQKFSSGNGSPRWSRKKGRKTVVVVWCGVVGQKTCMHVHGVFPYVFVRCDAAAEPPSSYLQEFAAGLDKAINAALGNVASTRQHVYKISLVSGMSVSIVIIIIQYLYSALTLLPHKA